MHIEYDEQVVGLEFLLNMFFKAIDPMSLNRQGHDEGTRYRTGVYYVSDDQLPIINKVFAEQQALYPEPIAVEKLPLRNFYTAEEYPIAVEKLPLRNFYTAEEYHQDYLDKNPDGYCHLPFSILRVRQRTRRNKLLTLRPLIVQRHTKILRKIDYFGKIIYLCT